LARRRQSLRRLSSSSAVSRGRHRRKARGEINAMRQTNDQRNCEPEGRARVSAVALPPRHRGPARAEGEVNRDGSGRLLGDFPTPDSCWIWFRPRTLEDQPDVGLPRTRLTRAGRRAVGGDQPSQRRKSASAEGEVMETPGLCEFLYIFGTGATPLLGLEPSVSRRYCFL
jgi:hypothetical protein